MAAAATHAARALELRAVVEGVDGAGVVHERERWAAEWTAFLAHFRDQSERRDGPVRGWELSRRAGTPEGAPMWIETWELHHYRSFRDADATETEFHEHLNAVVRAFRTATLTWGAIPFGIKIVVAEPRMFGGVLCHYAECSLEIHVEYDLL